MAQYKSAPDATIPQSEWLQTDAASVALSAGIYAVIAGVVLAVAGLVMRSRRRTFSGVAMQAAPAPAVQMSPDGGYWWDGQGWRDAAHEVPPFAQRSTDGHFWWDGPQWRPVT
jgi:hypothetical protein